MLTSSKISLKNKLVGGVNNVNLSTHFDGYFIFNVYFYLNLKSLELFENFKVEIIDFV
jgi:hypothetical protein